VLRSQFEEIGGYSQEHPWWGFTPRTLAPGDDAEIKKIIGVLVEQADQVLADANSYATFLGENAPPSIQAIAQACAYINEIPAPDNDLKAGLLPRFFPESDLAGVRSSAVLAQLFTDLERVRNLNDEACGVLLDGCEVQTTDVQLAIASVRRHMVSRLIQEPIEELGQQIASLASALDIFTQSTPVRCKRSSERSVPCRNVREGFMTPSSSLLRSPIGTSCHFAQRMTRSFPF
jgi:hypothetical protein